ncbi:MAG: adenylyltransferase/cytidyltransferase family protein [archaeon]
MKQKKVLVFGSYDLIHPGHRYFFVKAKKLGDKLIVVVARDSTIKKVKGKKPKFNENQRLKHVQEISTVDKAVLGNEDDMYKVIEEIKPDILALGYDQNSFTQGIKQELEDRDLSEIKIVRIDSYKPKKYKSSLLK